MKISKCYKSGLWTTGELVVKHLPNYHWSRDIGGSSSITFASFLWCQKSLPSRSQPHSSEISVFILTTRWFWLQFSVSPEQPALPWVSPVADLLSFSVNKCMDEWMTEWISEWMNASGIIFKGRDLEMSSLSHVSPNSLRDYFQTMIMYAIELPQRVARWKGHYRWLINTNFAPGILRITLLIQNCPLVNRGF